MSYSWKIPFYQSDLDLDPLTWKWSKSTTIPKTKFLCQSITQTNRPTHTHTDRQADRHTPIMKTYVGGNNECNSMTAQVVVFWKMKFPFDPLCFLKQVRHLFRQLQREVWPQLGFSGGSTHWVLKLLCVCNSHILCGFTTAGFMLRDFRRTVYFYT